MDIHIEHNPDDARLNELGVLSWPLWTKEVSSFPWSYSEKETCYFLEGDVEVVPDGGEPVNMGAGDLVIFPAGLSCTWTIREPVTKHYNFN